MKKRIPISVFLLSVLLISVSVYSVAQQPDMRVRLLTLYQLSQVTIRPVEGKTAKWSAGAARREFASELVVRAHGNTVQAAGQASEKITVEGDLQILGGRSAPEHVRGTVEIYSRDGSLWIIASLPVEEYVADVLQGETAGDMPDEALKAMAIAIRSYATRFRDRHKEEGFDFCDTTHCQYLRLDPQPAVVAAVKQTAGELLWDRGSPLAAYYHKDCGGETEDAAALWPDQASPALIAHPDRYCLRARASDRSVRPTTPSDRSVRPTRAGPTSAPSTSGLPTSGQGWRSEISRADLDRAILAAGLTVPAGWNRIAIEQRTPSGRAQTLRFGVGNSQSGIPVSASSFRFAVGRTLGWNAIKSDWFEISVQGDHFIFAGKGAGHGVGLCQDGAAEMARQGKGYHEILAFYYPGALEGRSAQGIAWSTVQTDSFELRVVKASDREVTRTAARSAMAWAAERSGLALHSLPLIEVYPTVAMFRDATGEPGWVAASTRHQRVQVQPPSVLRDRFESVLRHEFLHMLVEDNAEPRTPLWFREGLVVYLGGDPPSTDNVTMASAEIEQAITSRGSLTEMRQAYAQAAAMVRDLDQRHGRAQLLGWLRAGLPRDLHARVVSQSDKVSK